MLFRLIPLLFVTACALLPGGGSPADEAAARAAAEREYRTVQLTTVGYDTQTQSPVVLLREASSGRILPIWIGVSEAEAIIRALRRVQTPRPMTHDLMADLIANSGAVVEGVVVYQVSGDTYHAFIRLRINNGREVRQVESRPSDALALALRVGAPIQVAESLLRDVPGNRFELPREGEQVIQTLGITLAPVSRMLREQFDLPEMEGAVVIAVTGQLAAGGLQLGDLILEVAGRRVFGPSDVVAAIRGAEPDTAVSIRFWRDGAEHVAEVTLPRPGRRQRMLDPNPVAV